MATSAPTSVNASAPLGCVIDDDCSYVRCGGDPGLDSASCNNGSCVCSTRARFFIGIGMYISALLGIALYARFNSKAPSADRLRDHFMASSSFGTFVMTLSIFSTAFSGYTVVGVPEEASRVGFVAMRWLTVGVFVNVGALILYPRLRQIGVNRKYNSPTDIVGDRFNSNMLRLLTSVALVIPLFIYVTVQFISLANIVEGLSLGRIGRYTASWLLCAVIVFCEAMGGQRSVTISDSIQATIMLSAFLVMPFVLVYYYGGLPDIVQEGCSKSRNTTEGYLTGCAAYSRPWITMQPTVTGSCEYSDRFQDPNCFTSSIPNATVNTTLPSMEPYLRAQVNPDESPEFEHVTISMLMFNLNGIAFGLNPHFMQKVFAARSDRVLKHSLMLLSSAALVTNLPSLYYGFVRVAAMQNAKGTAFPVVTGEMIDNGGFSELIAVLAACSALAAIMSTADSTIIGANNLITVEWVKNYFWPNASPKRLSQVAQVITVVFAVSALIFSFNAERISFGVLFNLQNSFVWQPAPTFIAALYSDRVAAIPLLLGQAVGLIVCIAISVSENGDFVIPSGFVGLVANLAMVFIVQTGLASFNSSLANDDVRQCDRVDANVMAQYGSTRLTAEYISRHMMKGISEPLADRRNRWLVILAIVLVAVAHPWYHAPYTQQSVSSGLTAWALAYFLCYLIAVGIITYVYSTWGCIEENQTEAFADESVPRVKKTSSKKDKLRSRPAALVDRLQSPLVSDDAA